MIGGDLLGERARLTPDSEALVVVDPPLRLTYADLDTRATRCALAWRALGVGPGDRVALLSHNRVEMIEAFFAAGKTGTILVPLGTRLTAHELAPILADAGARVVLYDGPFDEIVAVLRAQLVDEEADPVEHWIRLDSVGDDGVRDDRVRDDRVRDDRVRDDRVRDDGVPGTFGNDDAASWVELCAAVDPAEVETFEATACDPEDVYCMLYTSGTTGRPKGVMIPHRMVAWNGYASVCGWQLRADDVSPIFTPLYHAGGLLAFLVPMMTIGGKVVLHRAFDAEEVWRTIESERCTVVLGVPTIWQMLLEVERFAAGRVDTASIRWLISGGAPLPTWIADAYRQHGLEFKQGFGMTEVGVNCFAMTIEDSRRKPGSIGKPMMHTRVRLVGEDGREVAVGEVGEMWFRGPHVSRGYWNRPDATAEVYDEDGWFHSGDLGRRDEDGFFYVAGRAKDVIISGGVNIYPAEIEAAMLRHPGVRDAALVGIDHPTWGEVGVAFVVPIEPEDASPDEAAATLEASLMEHLAERLARYKLPKDVRFVGEMPRNDYGKIVKPTLRQRYLADLD